MMISPQFPDETPATVSVATLRQFAGLCLVIFGGLFAWSWYRHHGEPTVAAWIGALVAVVVGLPGVISPPLVRPVYLGAMAVTQPIGHVISIVMLGLVYYGFVTPLAAVFRLAGRDALVRRQRSVSSYWTPKVQVTDVSRYLHQYQRQQAEISDTENGANHEATQLNSRS